MRNRPADLCVMMILLVGLVSIISVTVDALLGSSLAISLLGFSNYFSGVPAAFLMQSGLTAGLKSPVEVISLCILSICSIFVFMLWSSRVLNRSSSKDSVTFGFTFFGLCAFNFCLNYVLSVGQLVAAFSHIGPAIEVSNASLLHSFVLGVQATATICFMLIWERKSGRNDFKKG